MNAGGTETKSAKFAIVCAQQNNQPSISNNQPSISNKQLSISNNQLPIGNKEYTRHIGNLRVMNRSDIGRDICHISLGTHPHNQLCCSAHKCMFITTGASL